MKRLFLVLLLLIQLTGLEASVVVSLHPLKLVVSTISYGVVGVDEALVPATGCHHSINITPRQLHAIRGAELFIWVGPDMEAGLKRFVEPLGAEVELMVGELVGVKELLGERNRDWHIWLSPQVMMILAEELALRLAVRFPDKEERVLHNLSLSAHEYESFCKRWENRLGGLPQRDYLTTHNSIGHLGSYIGLREPLDKRPNSCPSPKSLAEISKLLANKGEVLFFKISGEETKALENYLVSRGVIIRDLDIMALSLRAADIEGINGMGRSPYFVWLEELASSLEESLLVS